MLMKPLPSDFNEKFSLYHTERLDPVFFVNPGDSIPIAPAYINCDIFSYENKENPEHKMKTLRITAYKYSPLATFLRVTGLDENYPTLELGEYFLSSRAEKFFKERPEFLHNFLQFFDLLLNL